MMESSLPQRRRPHHDVRPVSHRPTIVFLTVCVRDRRPVLANAAAHEAMVNAWKDALAWRVGRYVVMPDHVHLFATPALGDGPPPHSTGVPAAGDRRPPGRRIR